ncbi:CRISPR-associated helicase/endonuclease Cas3 [Sulfolobales archaeon HS-7]|nr:CRISPR-associated helicase/endonuclease Cas3 [Sulfolobales archaeon HS-7]
MKFYSHPDKEIRVHLREVGEGARRRITDAGREDLAEFAFMAGGLHDIGKYSRFFQEHLLDQRRVDCSDHALFSSIITLYTVKDDLYSVLSAISVYSHHGYLRGLRDYRDVLRNNRDNIGNPQTCLVKQYQDIKSKWSTIREEVEWVPADLPSLEELLRQGYRKVTNAVLRDKGWKEYLEGLLIFSSLIDADKHSAGNVEERGLPLPDYKILERHIRSLTSPNPQIRGMREELRNWALNYVQESPFITLVAPTGSGKTLAGSLVALKGGRRRVVYSLPFISIIEQNWRVLSDILSEENVMKFHHLAFTQKKGADETRDLESQLMLAESWDSPFIVTTFEALLATLFSPKNSNLKRLHNLSNSFLILDEVQALPLEYLGIIKKGLEEMTKHLNVEILMMTATPPLSVEPERPVTTVPDRYVVRFRKFDQVETPEELAAGIDVRTSTMIELNTIESAERVFKVLRDRGEKPYFLSTRIVPLERWRRIERIKSKIEKGERVILVTTQMVEAGVDIDFRRGYRDLGPIDAVVQTAGRINRNYGETGEVILTRVKRENVNSTDFSLIYGKLSEEVTLSTLKGWEKGFNERDISSILGRFYEEIRRRYSDFRTKEWENLEKEITDLNYGEVELKVIKEEPKYSVYVNVDEEAEKVLKELKEVLKQRGYQRRALLKVQRGLAEQYVVRAWDEPPLELDEELGWYLLKREDLEKYYDKDTGFRRLKNETAILW